jgi:hypothetical protein
MPYAIRPYRRSTVQCFVEYTTDPFQGRWTEVGVKGWSLADRGSEGVGCWPAEQSIWKFRLTPEAVVLLICRRNPDVGTGQTGQ